MTSKLTITKERLEEIILDNSASLEEFMIITRMALATMRCEPVFQCEFTHAADSGELQWHWEDVNKEFYEHHHGQRRILYSAPQSGSVVDNEPYGFTDGDHRGMIYEPQFADRLNNLLPVYRHAQQPVVPRVTCWSCRNEVEISAIGDCDGRCPKCDTPIHLDEEPYTSPQPAPDRDQVRREHGEWSQATFGNVGPVGPLKHLSKEALEAAAEPGDLSEWADMQFLLWDAQRRAGITDEQITQAMIEKLAVNKKRKWPEPKDGEPRLHIKEQLAPVVLVTDAMAYAFHHALTDSPLGDDDVEDIKIGLRAAFANVTTYQPLPVVLKEHQIRQLVNKLRDIAIEYHSTQQLRERIAYVVRAAMIAVAQPAPKSEVN